MVRHRTFALMQFQFTGILVHAAFSSLNNPQEAGTPVFSETKYANIRIILDQTLGSLLRPSALTYQWYSLDDNSKMKKKTLLNIILLANYE